MTIWMLFTVAASTVLGFAAFLGDRLAARFGLPRRFAWAAAALLAVAVPVIGGTRAEWMAQAGSVGGSESSLVTSVGADANAVSRQVIAPAPLRVPPAVADRAARLDGWLAGVWMLLSVGMFARLIAAIVSVRRAARSWTERRESVGAMLISRDRGPAAFGVLRPRIVIPQWLYAEHRADYSMLLEHELEHLRAGDTRLIFAGALLDAMFPWNVPLRWIVRRLRLAIEIDCDLRVVDRLGDARRYGMTLLAVSERLASPLPLGAALGSPALDLEARIDAITVRHARRVWHGAASMAAVAVIALGICACAPWPALVRTSSDSAPPLPVSHSPGRAQETPTAVTPLAHALRDSVDKAEMARRMEQIREWMGRYHPEVRSHGGTNAVTFVVDTAGRYVRSAAETLTRAQLINRLGPDLLADDATGASARPSRPASRDQDLEPWIELGVRRAAIHQSTVVQAKAGVWAPRRFVITILQLKGGG